MNDTKKQLHEAFVSNLTGAPLWESYSIISVSAFCFILRNLLACFIPILFISRFRFLFDGLFLIVFPILSVTLLSDYNAHLSIALFLIYCSFLFVSVGFPSSKLSTFPNKAPCDSNNRARFFSELRALLMIFTCVCILAVDFQSYPRRFAKTESYGSGIMDCGVGCFVIAMGSVSAFSAHSNLRADKMKSFRANISSILPLLVIGILRVVSLRSVDYQEHVTEYGSHWNFFITLAVVRVLSVIFSPMYVLPYWMIAALVTIFQQCLLQFGVEEYIISDSVLRDSFLASNREGLLTIPGYLALFYWGAHFGDLVRSHLNTPKGPPSNNLSLCSLSCRFAGTSFVTGIAAYLTSPISRRVTNFAYLMWTVSFCSYLMIVLLLADLCVAYVCKKRSVVYHPSNLLHLINRESLAYFLLANVATGCVNIVVDTLQYSDIASFFILVGYKAVVISLVIGKALLFNRLFRKATVKND